MGHSVKRQALFFHGIEAKNQINHVCTYCRDCHRKWRTVKSRICHKKKTFLLLLQNIIFVTDVIPQNTRFIEICNSSR